VQPNLPKMCYMKAKLRQAMTLERELNHLIRKRYSHTTCCRVKGFAKYCL